MNELVKQYSKLKLPVSEVFKHWKNNFAMKEERKFEIVDLPLNFTAEVTYKTEKEIQDEKLAAEKYEKEMNIDDLYKKEKDPGSPPQNPEAQQEGQP